MYVCSYLFLTIYIFFVCIIILFSYNNLCIKLAIVYYVMWSALEQF